MRRGRLPCTLVAQRTGLSTESSNKAWDSRRVLIESLALSVPVKRTCRLMVMRYVRLLIGTTNTSRGRWIGVRNVVEPEGGITASDVCDATSVGSPVGTAPENVHSCNNRVDIKCVWRGWRLMAHSGPPRLERGVRRGWPQSRVASWWSNC